MKRIILMLLIFSFGLSQVGCVKASKRETVSAGPVGTGSPGAGQPSPRGADDGPIGRLVGNRDPLQVEDVGPSAPVSGGLVRGSIADGDGGQNVEVE